MAKDEQINTNKPTMEKTPKEQVKPGKPVGVELKDDDLKTVSGGRRLA
ncbi:MAG TPA: hypothetical protein VNT30_00210 [Stellaceae bacterium]|nr:hypothetical protein [Stellaceae bacterium]